MKKSWGERILVTVLSIVGICMVVGFILDERSTYKTTEEAGAYVKEQLLNREENITVKCKAEVNPYTKRPDVGAMTNDIMKVVARYNGDAAEGDYLYSNVGFLNDSKAIAPKPFLGKSTTVTFMLHVRYYTTAGEEADFRDKADEIIQSLRLDGESEYAKVKAIYDYICNNVTYDYDAFAEHEELREDLSAQLLGKWDQMDLKPYSAYAAACENKSVCAGYAKLFYYLCNSVGLDCRIIVNDTHAWNFVKIDGKYYYCDATWDSERIGEYEYFLRGINDFVLHDGDISKFFWQEYSPLEKADQEFIDRGEFASERYEK